MRALLLSLLVLVAWAPAHAGEQGRIYDTKGRFAGSYRETPSGVIRLYGAKNEFVGTVMPSRSGGYRIYGERGEYKGSTYERPTGRSQLSEEP